MSNNEIKNNTAIIICLTILCTLLELIGAGLSIGLAISFDKFFIDTSVIFASYSFLALNVTMISFFVNKRFGNKYLLKILAIIFSVVLVVVGVFSLEWGNGELVHYYILFNYLPKAFICLFTIATIWLFYVLDNRNRVARLVDGKFVKKPRKVKVKVVKPKTPEETVDRYKY